MELKRKLDSAKGSYFCLRCMRYFNEVIPRTNVNGIEWLTCPLCKSPKVFSTEDEKPLNELDF